MRIQALFMLGFGALLLSTWGAATSQAASFEVSSVSLLENGTELVIQFQDREPVPSVCGLFVKRMEYHREFNALAIEVSPNVPCLNDRFGKRKGTLKWSLPESMRDRVKLNVSVNGELVGQVAIEQASAAYQPVVE